MTLRVAAVACMAAALAACGSSTISAGSDINGGTIPISQAATYQFSLTLRDLSIQPRGRSWPGSSLGRQKVALLTRVWVLSAQSLASGATRWFSAAGTRRPLHDRASHASDVRNSAKMW
jgi:hypothetical protein